MSSESLAATPTVAMRTSPYPYEGHLTFREFWKILWRGRLFIAGVTIGFAAIAVLASFLPQRKYEASTTVTVVSDDLSSGRAGGLGSLLSQYGDLASLAGISLPGGNRKSESLAVLQSEALTETYIQQNDLLPILFSDLWDPANHRWRTANPKKIPTLWKGNQFFKKNVRQVAEDSKTGLVTLTIVWRDPNVAAKWANGLIGLTNQYLRGKAIDQAERNIAYLNSEAEKTTVVEVRKAIYSLMETEIRKEMLARGSDEYALKVLDPAIAPEKPSFPRPILWALAGLFAGLTISVLVVFARAP